LLHEAGNLEEAEDWYRKAADLGDSDAAFNLGNLLHEAGNLEEAEDWYRKAADLGDSDAAFNLGNLLHEAGNLEEAEDWYRKAADLGDSDAFRALGQIDDTAEPIDMLMDAVSAKHSSNTAPKVGGTKAGRAKVPKRPKIGAKKEDPSEDAMDVIRSSAKKHTSPK
jgi:TPR repeat protein